MTSGSTGRRRGPLRLVPPPAEPQAPRLLGAVELLPGRVRAALLSISGEVLQRCEARYPAGTDSTKEIDDALWRAGADCFRQQPPPAGIGVAATGLVDAARGVIIEVNDVPALHGYPVTESLYGLFGVPAHVEHRARLQALGDRWFGAGRGRSTFASVSTGEVLGVGILYDGQVLAPAGGRSGAHMTVAAGGQRCTCGSRGCWKTLAAPRWLRAKAKRAGLGGDASLAALVEQDTPAAVCIVDEYADNLSLGLVNVQQLFAPGLFVLHGEARQGGERFRARIEQRLREDSSWTAADEPFGVVTAEQPSVVVGEGTVDDVALLGGAGLVLSQS